MMSCLKCGGAVGEPGKAYGYAGEWCHCTKPDLGAPGRIEWIPKDMDVGQFLRQREGVVLPSPAAMTAAEFVVWLRGYFAASGNPLKGDFDTIRAKLAAVGGPK